MNCGWKCLPIFFCLKWEVALNWRKDWVNWCHPLLCAHSREGVMPQRWGKYCDEYPWICKPSIWISGCCRGWHECAREELTWKLETRTCVKILINTRLKSTWPEHIVAVKTRINVFKGLISVSIMRWLEILNPLFNVWPLLKKTILKRLVEQLLALVHQRKSQSFRLSNAESFAQRSRKRSKMIKLRHGWDEPALAEPNLHQSH